MGNKQSATSAKSYDKIGYNKQEQPQEQDFVLIVTQKDTNEAMKYYGNSNESLINENNMYSAKFNKLNKQLKPIINEKSTNFIVKIYKKAKDSILYNKKKTTTDKETKFELFENVFKSAAEINNEHVTITLGIISTTALVIAPPIGLLIAASSILILKTLHTIRSNHELFDIMNDLLSLLTVITDKFEITNDNDAPHIVILKNHIIKIFSLMSSINGIYNWRKMAIFPNAIINSFIKEITLINTSLIVDLKIDLTNLAKNKNDKKVTEANVNEEIIENNDDAQVQKYESEQVNDILDTVIVNKKIKLEQEVGDVQVNNANLNQDIINLVNATNELATNNQIRKEYLTYLEQEQEQEQEQKQQENQGTILTKTNKESSEIKGIQKKQQQNVLNNNRQGGSKSKNHIHHKFKRTKMLKKYKNKTSKKYKNIKSN